MNNFSLTKDFHIPDTLSTTGILQNHSTNSGLPTDFAKALRSFVSQFSVTSTISFQQFITVTHKGPVWQIFTSCIHRENNQHSEKL